LAEGLLFFNGMSIPASCDFHLRATPMTYKPPCSDRWISSRAELEGEALACKRTFGRENNVNHCSQVDGCLNSKWAALLWGVKLARMLVTCSIWYLARDVAGLRLAKGPHKVQVKLAMKAQLRTLVEATFCPVRPRSGIPQICLRRAATLDLFLHVRADDGRGNVRQKS
jgi:hypothetical protein